ncbi:helix-turn-helix domain-containing protein [Citricoccus sp. CH26A]|uniref:helix-turn-helix domain-containing protein n=1 Tax=Citricoccus TaxID=169133 RepID=UPI001145A4CB|nr:helix-turn-helix domain-containing protein [Citricoccus sp. CH26A]
MTDPGPEPMTPTPLFEDPGASHPALHRFLRTPSGEERLLIVRAPMGTGAPWLAAGWVAAYGSTPAATRASAPEPTSESASTPTSDSEPAHEPTSAPTPASARTPAPAPASGQPDDGHSTARPDDGHPAARPGVAPAPGAAHGPLGELYGPEVRRRIFSWEQSGGEVQAFIDRVGSLLDDPDGGRVAVVGGHEVPVAALAAAFPTRLAGPDDVLLTVDEIEAYGAPDPARQPAGVPVQVPLRGQVSAQLTRRAATNGYSPKPLTPLQIHTRTGGWLRAVRILLDDPLGNHAAKLAVMSSLMRWLGGREDREVVEMAAFLPEFTEEILAAFSAHPAVPGPGPSLQQLQELGLVVRCSDGQRRMPTLVREALQMSVIDADPQRARELSEAAVDATTLNVGVETAVETALRDRAWKRLEGLILDHWVDLYMRNAPMLAQAVGRLPSQVISGLGVTGIVSRLMAVTRADGMDFMPAVTKPDYARDETAQRLRVRTARMPLDPDRRTLTLGIAELAHLRLSGHFAEAAEAAQRVRATVDAAVDSLRVSPAVAGFADLQAGIALHLADRQVEAKAAYEAAYFWGSSGEVDFIKADAAGKLALLSAHMGNLYQTRRWLEKVDEPLAAVRWGRPMLARAAILARIHVATAELEHDKARQLLAELPFEPDSNEFWAAHASAIAYCLTLDGRLGEAEHRIEEWRQQRPYACRAPLADRLLREVSNLAMLVGGRGGAVPDWDRNPMLANLEAMRCLWKQDFDGTLRALHEPERTNMRHRALADLAEVIARAQATPETADESVLRQLPLIARQGAELADLAYFHPFGWTPVFVRLGMIDDDEAARIAAVTHPAGADAEVVPELTPREQEVLRMLREGMTRKQMAASTFRAENTIKGQLRSLYAKLGASTSEEALEAARRYGL